MRAVPFSPYGQYCLLVVLSLTTCWLFIESFRHDLTSCTVPFYGAFIFLYFVTQVGLLFTNRSMVERAAHRVGGVAGPARHVSLLIVGYREDVTYWTKCLENAVAQDYPSFSIVVSVDGDDPEEDGYTVDTAQKVLVTDRPTSTGVVIIRANPHGGKRAAMAHGIRCILSEFPETHGIVVTDSDTRLHPKALETLVSVLDVTEDMGCATGSLRVFDKHPLGRVINARYAYAFDVERAAMSAFGVMNCCSGPGSKHSSS
jgi:cellulose synthase/poly-beta-1,6-N-acetylglucosamine synthase-like glycosyltransferase